MICNERELRFQINGNNQVSWEVVPKGERGTSKTFKDRLQAEHFAEKYARFKGLASKEITGYERGDY